MCGKYKRMKYKGIICEKCGVEVTLSRVRRERMGHIELAARSPNLVPEVAAEPHRLASRHAAQGPRAHPLFRILLRHRAGLTPLKERQLLSEEDYIRAQDEYGDDSFTALIGAEAIRELLRALDLEKLAADTRKEISEAPPS